MQLFMAPIENLWQLERQVEQKPAQNRGLGTAAPSAASEPKPSRSEPRKHKLFHATQPHLFNVVYTVSI